MIRSLFAVLLLLCGAVCFVAQEKTPSNNMGKTDQPTIGSIDGKVVNESGQPMAGAGVYVRTVNSGFNRSTTTDLEGNFRVNGLETGLYIVSANTPAYTNAPGDPDAPKYYRIGDSVRVDMVRGGAITGTVTNAMGEPVIAVRVRAQMIRDAKGQAARFSASFEQQTDDRGVYRIYGLPPGTYHVFAGGSSFIPSYTTYDTDIPTYAPSSTRDTAAEVSVRSGEDVMADIRYRGEPGHSISGSIKGSGTTNGSVTLMRPGNSFPMATSIQVPFSRGFIFNGLADGDYFLVAQESVASQTIPPVFTLTFSDPKKITVKGADITGIELVTKPLGSISGKIVLEPTKVPECQGKRPPLMAEALVRFRRPEKEVEAGEAQGVRSVAGAASPDTAGAFVLRNLQAGSYQFDPRFYARYWYLQSITVNSAGPKPQRTDAAANWTILKSGEQLSNVNITLAEGAASVHGKVPAPDAAQPPAVAAYLVPDDKDKLEDVLRYFVAQIEADGTFTFNNVPPGKYLAVTASTVEPQIANLAKLRQPDAGAARTKLRRMAEAKKAEIELKPCQNLSDYQLKQ
ncbi:MAG TPA: carboxypeptidase-like regulatory domain-containing protein [Pyrinomonadaceae bacterium]|nr:carboxypeptidase-like regulatory domain-containing protein [Pyrinomonadaceae bacterium]